MSETGRSARIADELARRRAAASRRPAPAPESTDRERTLDRLLAEAAADREYAAADRRLAAEHLQDIYRDDLSGVLNRRAGREQIEAEIDRLRRGGGRLAILYVDIDGLKGVNDSGGHDAGDRLLAAAGSALRSSFRGYDIIVRHGGDEFVCALPGATAATAESCFARALRALASSVPGATLTAGYAYLQPGDSLETVLHRADADLYQRRTNASPPRPVSVPSPVMPPGALHPGVECGACGGPVPLADFVLVHPARMTRSASCPECGARTLVQLAAHGDTIAWTAGIKPRRT